MCNNNTTVNKYETKLVQTYVVATTKSAANDLHRTPLRYPA